MEIETANVASARKWTTRELLVVGLILIFTWGPLIISLWEVNRRCAPYEPPEIETLNSALMSYKEKFGEYPPGNDPDEIRRHIRVAFPRYKRDGDPIADLQALGLDPTKLDAREVLVFWLAGLPQPDDQPPDIPVYRKLTGFNVDVTDPIVGDDPLLENHWKYRTAPFFDFILSRLIDSDGDRWLEYQVRGTQTDPIWYVYDPQKHEIVFSRDPEK